MKKLHKFIIKSYIGPFVITFFIATFLLLMQFLWKYIDDLVGKGLEWTVILKLMVYASTSLVPMALPLAILLSSIMTFGNLGENYELVALKSSGISLQRIMRPLILFIILVSLSAFFFSNNVMPYTNLKFHSILHDVRNQRPALAIKEGVFYNGIDGYSIKIGKKNKNRNILYNIMIYNHSKKNGNTNVVLADSGMMFMINKDEYLVLKLYNGYKYEEISEKKRTQKNRTYPFQRDKFDEETITFSLNGFGFKRTDESLWKDNFQMLDINQLDYFIDSLSTSYNNFKKDFEDNIVSYHYFKRTDKKDSTSVDSMLISNYKYVNTDSAFSTIPINKQKLIIDMALNYARSSKAYISSTSNDLNYRLDWINRYFIEWHRKFTLSISCFILFFIGAPLGAIIRKGGLGMPVVVSVLFFILYYVISITGEKFSREGVLPTYEGMWLSSVILMPLGIFLTYKATTDSSIFNIDSYLLPFKNFFIKVFKLTSKK